MTGRQTFDPETGQTSNGAAPRKRPRRRARVPDRYQLLIDGVITIDDLDDEELLKGKLRNSAGTFSGPAPKAIPWTMHQAAVDAVTRRLERRLVARSQDVLDALIDIAVGRGQISEATGARLRVDDKARVDAGKYLMDRIMGKTPERQEITATVTAKWEEAAAGGKLFVDIDPGPEDGRPQDVVDAELVEEVGPLPELETGAGEAHPAPADPVVDLGAEATPDRPRPQRKRPQRKITGVKL